jgi:phosphatidylglycerol:prolipoprotein diacylglycerol transferase
MLQELFRIPGTNIPIYGYGLMMVIGFLAALQLAKFLARHSGLDPEVFVNAGLIALVAGVVGARLSHIFENIGDFTRADRTIWQNFLDMVNLRSGGLTFYGGLLLAFPVTLLYGWLKRVPLRLGMDIVAPCVMVGLAFGRVGCFLNGCCYGAECQLPWAVQFPYDSNAYVDHVSAGEIKPPAALERVDANGQVHLVPRQAAMNDPQLRAVAASERSRPVHPAQLYSTLNAFLLASVLVAFFTLRHAPGQVFALMFILDGATRFILEMLRTEPAVIGQGTPHLASLPAMSFSMVVGILLVVGGIVMWYLFGRFGEKTPGGLPVEHVPAAARQPAH